MTVTERSRRYRTRVELALERSLPAGSTHPARFHTALRYAVLGGGKRLRPALVYATGECIGIEPQRLDAIALAVEFVHAYSLAHDDLPAMDDDTLRRGQPTVHVAFDEATAILVGDALQAHAYSILADHPAMEAAPAVRRQLVLDLALASGSEGMVGGQMMDVETTGATGIAAAQLDELYARKTGALLRAAVIMPSRLRPDLGVTSMAALETFARSLGLAYQVADDLLDIESPAAVSGKPQGSDLRHGKATVPALLGVEASRQRLHTLRDQALAALAPFGAEADALREICEQATRRNH
ncbi:MAG: polyprenyl synthetase family protein [Gammaproteobacteria bacterium]|nr:MAG: polyprenyl synthetase family protein [Gammaproteobacteria bacterium]